MNIRADRPIEESLRCSVNTNGNIAVHSPQVPLLISRQKDPDPRHLQDDHDVPSSEHRGTLKASNEQELSHPPTQLQLGPPAPLFKMYLPRSFNGRAAASGSLQAHCQRTLLMPISDLRLLRPAKEVWGREGPIAWWFVP